MACPAKMGMTESKDGIVIILISRAVSVGVFIIAAVLLKHWLDVGIRAQLHHAERGACPGEGMAHVFGSNKGINVLN